MPKSRFTNANKSFISAVELICPDDLELAARVHYSFLPEEYSDDRLDLDIYIEPHHGIGGDYCSILPLDEHRLMVNMCDVVGHGMASALYATRINTFVLTHAQYTQQPCVLINDLNAFLSRSLPDTGMYSTFFSAFIDLEAMTVCYAGAAHPPALHYDGAAEEVGLLESHTTLLGIEHPLLLPCVALTRTIHPGDKLVLHTDGLMEARNTAAVCYGMERFQQFVGENHSLACADFNHALYDEVAGFTEKRFTDDILLMTLNIK